MNGFTFTWDLKKAAANARKHGVTFEEAMTIFDDPASKSFYDPDHSPNEDRFILVGMSAALRLLVVCHCYRENDETVRIISARRADKDERSFYTEV